MSDAFNTERSRLMQKHRDELAPLIKNVKSKKGLMKEAAQKKVDEVSARHEAELAEFAETFHAKQSGDAAQQKASDASSSNNNATPAAPAAKGEVKKAKKWPVLNWTAQARSELEQACADRGLSKKGKKEELVVRLTLFSQEQTRAFETGELVPASDSESDDEDSGSFEIVTKVVAHPNADPSAAPRAGAGRGGKRGGGAAGAPSRGAASAGRGGGRGGGAAGGGAAPKKHNPNDDDDDDDDDDADDKPAPAAGKKKKDDDADNSSNASDDDDDDVDPYANETPEQKEERERLEKRRTAVIGCIYRILKADEEDNDGIHMDTLAEQLAQHGVKNFRPELVGYSTIEEFLEEEQGKYFKFGSNTKLIKLIRERDESAQAKRKPNARQKHNGSNQRGGPRFQ